MMDRAIRVKSARRLESGVRAITVEVAQDASCESSATADIFVLVAKKLPWLEAE
jgi:hypothetical protein